MGCGKTLSQGVRDVLTRYPGVVRDALPRAVAGLPARLYYRRRLAARRLGPQLARAAGGSRTACIATCLPHALG